MHTVRTQTWLVLGAWLLFFTPNLLPGASASAVGHLLLSALCFAPLLLVRPLLPVVLGLLTLLGCANIVHASFFGALVDEFFLATLLRTTPAETAEFLPTVPSRAWVGVGLWLLACAWATRTLWRTLPQVRGKSLLLRRVWQGAGLFWVLVLVYTLVQQLNANTFMRKAKSLYPLHVARAAMRQQEIATGLFQPPVLPSTPPDASTQVDTIVVVLGESASAQRWSLLGYRGANTNAPLADIPGIAATTVLAQGWNTAAALPYMLTGMSALESSNRRAPTFLDLAQHAGYKTFTFSNSRFFSAQEDFFSYALRRASAVYQKVGNGDLDEVLTDSLRTALADPAPRKLIVLHTYGSHPLLQERTPRSYRALEDAYDNNIHYSSHLLAQWVALLRDAAQDHKEQHSALLLYTSDHGILFPPCAEDYRHGAGLTSFEVPMLIWTNPALRAQHPSLLPAFAQPEGDGANLSEHSNALLAELAIRAVGYGDWLLQPGWPSSANPSLNGRPWTQLRQLNACTLQ